MQSANLALYLVVASVVCFLTFLPGITTAAALSTDDRPLKSTSADDGEELALLGRIIRDKIRREIEELNEAESRIVEKMMNLDAERQNIIARKRGHRPCLVNLIACYRKRK